MQRRGRSSEAIARLERSRNERDGKILKTIHILTPGCPHECSTHEITAALLAQLDMDISVRVAAALLVRLQKRGLVLRRVYVQRHLWRLTEKGRRMTEDRGQRSDIRDQP